jgi:hypothetical protein
VCEGASDARLFTGAFIAPETQQRVVLAAAFYIAVASRVIEGKRECTHATDAVFKLFCVTQASETHHN